MLPGFHGRLISSDFLETELAASARNTSDGDAARRQLARWRETCCALGPATSLRALFETAAAPLVALLGFGAPTRIEFGRNYVDATLASADRTLVLMVVPWAERLDAFWRTAAAAAIRRSAAWAILFNGTHIRVIDPSRVYARPYAEFEIDLTLDDDRAAAAFRLLLGASAFSSCDGKPPRLQSFVDRSDQFAAGVSRSLRDGVLAASEDVLMALLRPARPHKELPPLQGTFEQALTIVYRILFQLFAEARSLVPLWHPVYRQSYSVESLRSIAERSTAAPGLWDALRAMARLAHAGCRVGDLRVTPFNGRLFAPHRTPLAERRDLDEAAIGRAVLSLSTRPEAGGAGRQRIAYRDLGVEQLGAVYETLLDYEPRINPAAAAERRSPTARVPDGRVHDVVRRSKQPAVALVRGSGVRKATGSFYTPQPIADYLVRRTLAPLALDAPPERILALRVLDPAVGSGAFLVAACRFLADAYEQALIRSGGCSAADFDERERVLTRRTIAERCLFGVDLNPMAVQLARLSLWLATLAADRPLTFLDHHLLTGDSLVGAWLEDLRRTPRTARRRREPSALPLFDEGFVAALRSALPIRFTLAEQPGDTIERVREKERALGALTKRDSLLSRWKRVADAWCAPWFPSPDSAVHASAFPALSDALLTNRSSLPQRTTDAHLAAAAAIAERRRMFHWELEFPEVFFTRDGLRRADAGFDAVLGNPPWDMVRGDAGPLERRADARSDASAFLRFARDSGAYAVPADGHANRYQLFLERSMALLKPGGRLGMVLPGGLLTDSGSGALRRQLLRDCRVDALVGFDNQRGVFPIHRSVRFVLLTASRGSPTEEIACRLDERDPAALEHIGDEPAEASPSFPVRVTPSFLERISGDGLAIPHLRSAMDVAILDRAAALFPSLGSDAGWRAHFGRELNATEDRAHFRAPGRGLPIVEGKLVQPFSVDTGAARFAIARQTARRLLNPPRYEHSRLAYRDVASATNRLTLIAAVLPAGCVSTHTLFCLRTPLTAEERDFLCGLFNSFVLNYFVRLRVTTHVTTAVVERLPVPGRHHHPGAFRDISSLAAELAGGHSDAAYAALQARVAGLYQLTADEFEYVLDTFPLVPKETRDAALSRFRETHA